MDYGKLARKIFSAKGWPSLIYMVGNILVTAFLVSLFAGGAQPPLSFGVCILIAIVLQLIVTLFDFSPIGEFVLRTYNGGRKIRSNEYRDYLNPLFEEVYARAKKECPNLPDNIKLYIKNEDTINAFAIGRRSIVINTGTLGLSTEEIKGILGHEFGHIAHQDTAATMIILGGNIFVFGIAAILGYLMAIICTVTGVGTLGNRTGKEDKDSWLALLVNTVIIGLINLFVRIWVFFGALTFKPMMRQDEFDADAFSTKLGYGYGMLKFFGRQEKEKPQGLIGTLERTHPTDYDRIQAIQNIMKEDPSLQSFEDDFEVLEDNPKSININIELYETGDSVEKDDKSDNAEQTHGPVAAFSGSKVRINNENIICPHCGYEIKVDATFCPRCGEAIYEKKEYKCTDCEYIAQNDQEKFCPMCGKELKEVTVPIEKEEVVDEQPANIMQDVELQDEDTKQTITSTENNDNTEREKQGRNTFLAAIFMPLIIGVILICFVIAYNNYNSDSGYIDETEVTEEEETAFDMDPLDTQVVINEDLVSVRKEPNNAADIIGQVNKGDILNAFGKNEYWYEVEYGDSIGYINKEYATDVDETTVSEDSIIEYQDAYIDGELYNNIDMDEELATFDEGEEIGIIEKDIVDEDGDVWYKVEYDGQVGYVMENTFDVY